MDPPPSPLISTSKHHRISIWRNEVASASLQYDPAPTSSSPSLAATTAILSLSSSSSSSPPSSLARSALLRGRQILRRLSGRLARDTCSTVSTVSTASTASSSVWSHRPHDVILRPPCFDDPVFPTAMYSLLRPDNSCLDEDEDQGQDRLRDVRARPRLTESQRRLQRAARLLQHGVKTH